jgi:hypothetical protein
LGDILLRIETEIGQRSLSTIPTDKLLDIYLKYSNQIKAELEPVNENKERDPITIIFTKN